jgi:hypothetical protein
MTLYVAASKEIKSVLWPLLGFQIFLNRLNFI